MFAAVETEQRGLDTTTSVNC